MQLTGYEWFHNTALNWASVWYNTLTGTGKPVILLETLEEVAEMINNEEATYDKVMSHYKQFAKYVSIVSMESISALSLNRKLFEKVIGIERIGKHREEEMLLGIMDYLMSHDGNIAYIVGQWHTVPFSIIIKEKLGIESEIKQAGFRIKGLEGVPLEERLNSLRKKISEMPELPYKSYKLFSK